MTFLERLVMSLLDYTSDTEARGPERKRLSGKCGAM